jgi:hypothetical protein
MQEFHTGGKLTRAPLTPTTSYSALANARARCAVLPAAPAFGMADW